MQLAHWHIVTSSSATHDVPHAFGHRGVVRCFQNDSKFVDYLVASSQLRVEREELAQRLFLVVGGSLPSLQDHPAGSTTHRSHFGSCAKENRASQFAEGIASALHDMKRVMDNDSVFEFWIVSNSFAKWGMHVHRE